MIAGLTAILVFVTLSAQAQSTAQIGGVLPARATNIAGEVDHLFTLIHWITSGILVVLFGLLAFVLVRFRAGRHQRARYSKGKVWIEVVLAGASFSVLIYLALLSSDLWGRMTGTDSADGREGIEILVRPRQFQWDVRYAGADGILETDDDITAINQLHVPSRTNITLRLRSQDVIHSFFVPAFRMKQDAVPGMTTTYSFRVEEPGTYEVACAELCGLGHYRMKAYLTVHDSASFQTWYGDQLARKRGAK